MEVAFTKQFEKDVRKTADKNLAYRIELVIFEVKTAKEFSSIHNLKKLSGFKNYYRIRIGDYRIGIFINKDVIEFSRFMHRKEIYRYFP